ncbi:hypothetical protein SK128_015111, partial [Halocaridina rubra]
IFPKYYRSPYIPRGDSFEDEGGIGYGSDLTRSITAPSFITRDVRSREPSQDDLLGSVSSLPQGQQLERETAELTVINIKHALSDTLAEGHHDDSNISSVHIGGPEEDQGRGKLVDDNEEGPFTITFKNVSEAPAHYTTKVGLESEAEDHEVLGVLQGEGVSSGRPPGGGTFPYTNPENITNLHILTGTQEPCHITNQYLANNRLGNTNLGGVECANQTSDTLELSSGASANLQRQSSLRLVRFAESKGRSEHSESSDSSAERSSSLFVECDSDRHSVSDVLSDDLNPPSARLVVAHITDVESVVQRRSISTSRSFDETSRNTLPHFERQYSEIIPDSLYLAREHLIPPERVELNHQTRASGDSSSVQDSTSKATVGESKPLYLPGRLSSGEEEYISSHPPLRGLERAAESPTGTLASNSGITVESNHAPSLTTTTTTDRAATSTVATTTTSSTVTVSSLSTSKSNMTVTKVAGEMVNLSLGYPSVYCMPHKVHVVLTLVVAVL